jgi:hypothetical protein
LSKTTGETKTKDKQKIFYRQAVDAVSFVVVQSGLFVVGDAVVCYIASDVVVVT